MVRLSSAGGVFYLGPLLRGEGLHGLADTLLVSGDGGRVRAHRAVLAAACQVFQGAGGRQEQQEDEQVVLLPDYEKKDLEAFVEVVGGVRESAEGEGLRELARDTGFLWGDEDAVWPECEVRVKEEVGSGDLEQWNGDWDEGEGGGKEAVLEEIAKKQLDRKMIKYKITKKITVALGATKPMEEVPMDYDDQDMDYGDEDYKLYDNNDDDDNDEDYDVYADVRPPKPKPRSTTRTVKKRRKERALTTIQKDEDGKEFLCPFKDCTVSDADLRAVCQHIARAHGDFVCQYCFWTTSNSRGLQKHLKRTHTEDDKANRLCTQCWSLFTSDTKVAEHLLVDSCGDFPPSSTRAGWVTCPEEGCSYAHPSHKGMFSHLRWTHMKRQCIFCGDFYPKVEDLSRHIRLMHSGQPCKPCFICNQTFASQVERKHHMVCDHTAKEMVKLEDNTDLSGGPMEKCFTGSCDFVTNDRLEMVQHGMVDHRTKAMCPFCGVVHVSVGTWKNHQAKFHSKFASHMCTTCYAVFWEEEDLELHRRKNDCKRREETMMCHVCGKSIRLKSLSSHVKKCKGKPERPSRKHELLPSFRRALPARKDASGMYHCVEEGCTFRADKSNKVYSHFMRKHNRQDCPHCGRNLSAYQIFQHIATMHTGETNVKCEHCPEKFFNRTLLRQHVEEVHVAAPVYVCEFCSQGFTSRRGLVNHRSEKHTRTRKWPCSVCGRYFRSRTLIKPHMMEAHGIRDP